MHILLVAFAATLIAHNVYAIKPSDKLNMAPIIGVLAQEVPKEETLASPIDGIPKHGSSYILGDYIQWLEMGGARVVPIPIDMPEEKIRMLFKKMNGAVFPGGDVPFFTSKYYKNAELIFKLAKEENDKGNHFPIWGTCQGLQTMNVLVAQTESIISPSDTMGVSYPLNFTDEIYDSKLFASMPKDQKRLMELEPMTINAHRNCVSHDSFQKNKKLSDFFRVVSTNTDKTGKTFISTIEAKSYPFYGSQWHPEKPAFNFLRKYPFFDGKAVNHSPATIRMCQYFANFFVDESRRSPNRFADWEEEEKYMIYKYRAFHSGIIIGAHAEQEYIFR